MFLSLTSTAPDAADLGYLLHKHPDRAQRFDVAAGVAHVFYPEVEPERCTAALLLEVDPIALVRGRRFGGDSFALAQYVNDRPYAASSMLAVALGKVFATAMKGRCTARPELEGRVLPLTIRVPALPSDGGADLVTRLFEPLGWRVETHVAPLDPHIPQWGDAPYVDLTLTGDHVLADALTHLYVLLPVLDDAKHYWVSADEVDKLIRSGGDWLATHPERDLITHRYLAHQRSYVADATARLTADDPSITAAPDSDTSPPTADVNADPPRAVTAPAHADANTDRVAPAPVDPSARWTAGDASTAPARTDADVHPHAPAPTPPADATAPRPLRAIRLDTVLATLREVGAQRVVDVGCGEGALLAALLTDPGFSEVVGVDVSARELDRAEKRLGLDRMPDRARARLTLRQSSVTYRDSALNGYDAIVLMEVVEHVDPDRLPALERTVFAHARPRHVIVTTPNAEYNVRYASLPAGSMRHADHRFEWTRAEFRSWAEQVAAEHGYRVRWAPVGEVDPDVGPSTQLAVFTRDDPTPGDVTRDDVTPESGHARADESEAR